MFRTMLLVDVPLDASVEVTLSPVKLENFSRFQVLHSILHKQFFGGLSEKRSVLENNLCLHCLGGSG